MKVCCFIDSLGSGGAQRQMVNLAIGLLNRGYQVVFLTYHEDNFFLNKLIEEKIERKIIQPCNTVYRILRIVNFFRCEQPDVVISFLQTPNLIAGLASIFPHKWLLITSERNSKEEIFNGIRGRLTKFAERFADWKVCNSKKGQQMWEDRCKWISTKISTIYNPVIIDEITTTEQSKNTILNVVVAASYQYTKNPVAVAKALTLLKEDERNRIIIDWYGRIEVVKNDTRAFDETKSIVTKYNLQKCFRLHSETKEIYSIMKKADVVGLFSIVEGLPNAVCEGMMLGKPIIMTPVSDYTCFVTNRNGILCEGFEPIDIAKGLRKLLNLDTSILEKMGENSKAISNELFDCDKNIDRWSQLIQGLKNKGEKSGR